MHTSAGGHSALDVRAVQRRIAALLPEARPAAAGESTLEIAGQGMDAPRLISATVLESGRPARPPGDRPPAGGLPRLSRRHPAQRGGEPSRRACPVILGRAAAVVRERRERRMHTWGAPLVESRLYCPRTMLPATAWSTLAADFGDVLVDSGERAGEAGAPSLRAARRRGAPGAGASRARSSSGSPSGGARASATRCSSTGGSAAASRWRCPRARWAW